MGEADRSVDDRAGYKLAAMRDPAWFSIEQRPDHSPDVGKLARSASAGRAFCVQVGTAAAPGCSTAALIQANSAARPRAERLTGVTLTDERAAACRESLHVGGGDGMAWETQGIRFVLYSHQPNVLPEAAEVWKILYAPREADNIQRNVQMAPGINQSLASGPMRGLTTTITVQPTRLDMFFNGPDLWAPNPSGKTIGISDLIEPVRIYGKKLISAFPTIRVAVVLEVVDPSKNLAEATEKFSAAFPDWTLPKVTRECAFSLNAPIAFQVDPKLTMYRLCKWETATYQFMMVPAGVPQAQAMTMAQLGGQQQVAFALQTDLSSELRGIVMPAEVATAVLDELCDETSLIVEQGYRRLAQ